MTREKAAGYWQGCVEVVDAVVENERGDAVLERGSAGDEITAQAVAEQDDLIGGDLAAGQRVVDDRGDHRFPIGAHDQFLFAQRDALSGAVERQDVVSSAQRGGGAREVGQERTHALQKLSQAGTFAWPLGAP